MHAVFRFIRDRNFSDYMEKCSGQVKEKAFNFHLIRYDEHFIISNDRLYDFISTTSTDGCLSCVSQIWPNSIGMYREYRTVVLEKSKAFEAFEQMD